MHIKDEIRKCVSFIAWKKSTEEQPTLCGTGFFVGVPLNDDQARFAIYLVTARHVIEGIKKKENDGFTHIRLNLTNGTSKYVVRNLEEWVMHPKSATCDVATIPFQVPSDYDHKVYPTNLFTTEETIRIKEIGVGDDVFITGLFKTHAGQGRNIPIIRVGNIAGMPEVEVSTKSMGNFHAYLIECRSIGGLSGSPVFVFVDPFVDQQSDDKSPKLRVINLGQRETYDYRLLGLVHGHWDCEAVEDFAEEDIAIIQSLRINMGIAIVVPASEILEVLNQPKLVQQRKSILAALSTLSTIVSPDPTSEEPHP